MNEQFPTVVLVPGMWHGAWCWEAVQQALASRGVESVAVELPRKAIEGGRDDFVGHCEYLQRVLRDIGGSVVLVGHSYGGAVLSEAGRAENVIGHIYVSAFNLEPGESVASLADAQAGAANDDAIDLVGGYLAVDHETAISAFYHDVPYELAETSFAKLVPEEASTRNTPATDAAWRDVPSHFVICMRDRAITLGLQRILAQRLDSSSEIETGHMPMLVKPAELADRLIDASKQILIKQGISASL